MAGPITRTLYLAYEAFLLFHVLFHQEFYDTVLFYTRRNTVRSHLVMRRSGAHGNLPGNEYSVAANVPYKIFTFLVTISSGKNKIPVNFEPPNTVTSTGATRDEMKGSVVRMIGFY
jgi:hypothetical protein